jgi:aminoglycoside phosphotransferase (APT) family kinase protein
MIIEQPNKEHLQGYLRHQMAGAEDLQIVEMKRSYPGMSRETWFITARWTDAGQPQEKKFVFRYDLRGGGLGFRPMSYEGEVYRRLEGTDVPTPKLLWYENRENWRIDGRDFMVREMVDGVTRPEGLDDPSPEHDATRVAVVKELLEKLALVHRLDWEGLGFGEFMDVPESRETCALGSLDYQLDQFRATRLEPFPAVTEAVMWMKENLPPPPDRIVLRKENNGIGEEVWQGTRIVAMCDWETASLGDPALDLAIAMKEITRYWNVPDAIAHYETHSGYRIRPENLEFYARYWNLSACVGLHHGLRGFKSEGDRRIQLVTLGMMSHTAQSGLAKAAGF